MRVGGARSMPYVDIPAGFIILGNGVHLHVDGLMKLTCRFRIGKSLIYRKPKNSRYMVGHDLIKPFVDAQEPFLKKQAVKKTVKADICGDYTSNKLESPEGKV